MEVKFLLVLLVLFGSVDSYALEACAKSHGNGGQDILNLPNPIKASVNPQNTQRDIAKETQRVYGNNVAFNSDIGITLNYTISRGSVANSTRLPALGYSGQQSIGQFILQDVFKLDQGKSDGNPCDPKKNAANGATSSGGGGGGGTSGGSGLNISGSVWVNGICVSNCKTPVVTVHKT